MPERRLSNARVQGWLAEDLDRVSDQVGSPKAMVNSAAVWWFCLKLTPEERARILGEFVTTVALRDNSDPNADENSRTRRARRRPKTT